MEAEILAKVIDLAAKQVGVDPKQVTAETHFLNDLQYDSLDVIDFSMKIEEEFEVSIPDEEGQNLKLVGDVVKFIEEARKHAAP